MSASSRPTQSQRCFDGAGPAVIAASSTESNEEAKMAFRVRDLLVAVSPVDFRGIPIGLPNVADDCTRCTGFTADCSGCTRIQCSNYPTNNRGVDFTIYEAVQDFNDAE